MRGDRKRYHGHGRVVGMRIKWAAIRGLMRAESFAVITDKGGSYGDIIPPHYREMAAEMIAKGNHIEKAANDVEGLYGGKK